MGNPTVKTPHLDRFASSGTAFTRCYMPGGSHGAVCMPSRAMIHTGRPLFQIEHEGQDIADDHVMIGEHFQSEGYQCFHTGKWHNGSRSFAKSFNDGEDIFLGGMEDQWNIPVFHFDPSGLYGSRLPYVKDPFHESTLQHRYADHVHSGVHATTLFTGTACKFLENCSKDKPFFLSVALTAPHDPRNAPQEFHDRYPPEEIPLPENFLAMHPHQTGAVSSFNSKGEKIEMYRDEDLAELPRKPSEIKKHLADYYAMISHLDHEFGTLLNTLESEGLKENTLVVFTADHGLAVGQHGLMGKQCVYEHSVRVPLIMSGPGVPEGQTPDSLVCHYDIFQTLCELTGTNMPSSVMSSSLIDTWESGQGRDELYLSYQSTIRGLVKDGWKLIEYFGDDGYRASQLFDLDSDPLEKQDRIHDPFQGNRISALRARLLALSDETGDRVHRSGQECWAKLKGPLV